MCIADDGLAMISPKILLIPPHRKKKLFLAWALDFEGASQFSVYSISNFRARYSFFYILEFSIDRDFTVFYIYCIRNKYVKL